MKIQDLVTKENFETMNQQKEPFLWVVDLLETNGFSGTVPQAEWLQDALDRAAKAPAQPNQKGPKT